MSLEDFLADLGDVPDTSLQLAASAGSVEYKAASLSRFDQFNAIADDSLDQATSLARDFHKEIAEIADITRTRLKGIAPELVSLFPKNSETVRVLVDLSHNRPSDAWLDRSRQLALSTSLATVDQDSFRQIIFDLQTVSHAADRILAAQQTITAFLTQTVPLYAPALMALLQEAELVARLILAAGGLPRLAALTGPALIHVGKEHAARRLGAQGILASSVLVTSAALADQPRVLKTLANKAVLAARVDAFRTPRAAMTAAQPSELIIKETFERRLKKTPLQPHVVKPLPVPTAHKEKTHRAGRRLRKKKEIIRQRVVASRIQFGVLKDSET